MSRTSPRLLQVASCISEWILSGFEVRFFPASQLRRSLSLFVESRSFLKSLSSINLTSSSSSGESFGAIGCFDSRGLTFGGGGTGGTSSEHLLTSSVEILFLCFFRCFDESKEDNVSAGDGLAGTLFCTI